MALDNALAVREIVVGQLFAGPDVAAGANPDLLADDLAITVRLAGVVDEAADVAANHGVPHPLPVHGEAPDLTALQVLALTLEALLVIDQLAFIGNDALVLVDGLKGKDAPTVELGSPPDDS